MAVKEISGVATGAIKEAAQATATITNSFAEALDNFIDEGLKTEVSAGFKLQGRNCRATLILEFLHAEGAKG